MSELYKTSGGLSIFLLENMPAGKKGSAKPCRGPGRQSQRSGTQSFAVSHVKGYLSTKLNEGNE